jgi:hypothetical protein
MYERMNLVSMLFKVVMNELMYECMKECLYLGGMPFKVVMNELMNESMN